jgi:hypothetical protein
MSSMAVNVTLTDAAADLDEQEVRALAAGAAWYFNYHRRIIADLADDRSAHALVRREEFDALSSALRKLGVRMRPPGLD